MPKNYINEVAKNAVTSIITTNKGHISTGVIGVQWLLRELSRRGHANVAYLLATNKTYPSWGYMVEKVLPLFGSYGTVIRQILK